MQSESARMSSAAEARYRIDAPNSKAALGQGDRARHAERARVKELSQRQWNRASFFTASAFGGTPKQGESFSGWLSDLAGRTKNLIEEVNSADLVVMVAAAGEERASRFDHRRGLQRQAGDDDGTRARRPGDFRRSAVEDAVASAAVGADAGDRQRRGLHCGYAHGIASIGGYYGHSIDRGGRTGRVVSAQPMGLRGNVEGKDGNLHIRRRRSETHGREAQGLLVEVHVQRRLASRQAGHAKAEAAVVRLTPWRRRA
jgi:hypothetical protein